MNAQAGSSSGCWGEGGSSTPPMPLGPWMWGSGPFQFPASGSVADHEQLSAAGGGGLALKLVYVLDKYFTIAQMPVVSSTYWNMVHGNTPEEVRQDAEGMQTMRNLARNLLWMVQCIQAGKAAGLQPPQAESKARTNFIR